MTGELLSTPTPPLERQQIEIRLRSCPRLPSLSSVNSALRELLNADQRYTSQIAEIIRRDPSLTARLLRLVNSVYYGLTTSINSIEEAVFYLGVRQIRQLAMVTPIIEDFQRLAGNVPFRWRQFWQHCIAVALLTREIVSSFRGPNEEVDYVAGLIHDVGKITMAAAFPQHFQTIYRRIRETREDLAAVEREILGMDHCELGAMYLESHHLPDVMVQAARFHHEPEKASHHAHIVAAVQIADLLGRHARIGDSGNPVEVRQGDWLNVTGWLLLFPEHAEEERAIAEAHLRASLERLPSLLEGLV